MYYQETTEYEMHDYTNEASVDKGARVGFLIFGLLASFLLVISFAFENSLFPSLRIACWIVMLSFIIVFLFNMFILKLHALSFPQCFLGVTYIFTFGLLMIYAFGADEALDQIKWFSEYYASVAVQLIMMAVFCYEVGICFSCIRRRWQGLYIYKGMRAGYAQSLFRLGLICTGLTLLIYILSTLLGGGFMPLLTGGYRGYTYARKGQDMRFFMIALTWLMPISSIILASSWKTKYQFKIANISILFSLFIFIASGLRANAFTCLLAFLIVMRIMGKKYSYKKVTIIALIVLVSVPLIGIMRHHGISGAIQFLEQKEEGDPSLIVSAVAETGGSFQTFMGTLMIIPERESYRYGKTFFWAFMRIWPNLGRWSSNRVDRGLTTWITSYMNPHAIFAGKGGLGFLQIGEFYVQFGILGICFGYIIFGVLLMAWQAKSEYGLKNRRWIAVYGCVFYGILLWIRNDSFIAVRPIFWSLGLIFLGTFVLGGRGEIADDYEEDINWDDSESVLDVV